MKNLIDTIITQIRFWYCQLIVWKEFKVVHLMRLTKFYSLELMREKTRRGCWVHLEWPTDTYYKVVSRFGDYCLIRRIP